MRFLTIASLVFIVGLTQLAAQSPELLDDGCSAVLVQRFMSTETNSQTFKAMLKLIGRDSWNELKSSGGFGFQIILKELPVPLGANASFEDFQTRRDQYLAQHSFTATDTASAIIVEKDFSADQVQAWKECKAQRFSEGYPLTYQLTPLSQTQARFVLHWHPPAGVVGRISSFNLQGGTMMPPFQVGKEIKPNSHPERLITRTGEIALSIVIANAYYVTAYLPNSPKGFFDNHDNTVSDIQGRVMWTRSSISGHSIEQADSYCRGLRLVGESGWRLPTASDLARIFDGASATRYKTVPEVSIDGPSVWSLDQARQPVYRNLIFDFQDGVTIAVNQSGFRQGESESVHPRTLCVRSLPTP